MKVVIKKDSGNTLISIDGRLDTANAADFQKKIEELSDADAKHVTVDCEKMEYISSSGLRAFISMLKRANRLGGKVTVKNLGSSAKEVFDMTGFTALFGL